MIFTEIMRCNGEVSKDNTMNIKIHNNTFATLLEQFTGSIIDLDNNMSINERLLKNTIEQMEKLFYKNGMQKLSVVALICDSPVFFIISFFSLIKYGVIPVLLSKKTTKHELEILDKDITIQYILTDTNNWDEAEYKSYPINCLNYIGLLYVKDQQENIYCDLKGMILQPTSGTTGMLKLCVRDEYGCIAEPVNHAHTVKYIPSSIFCPLPLNHAYGFGTAFLQTMISSSNLFVCNEVNPKKIIRSFNENKIELFTGIPAIYDLINKTRTDKRISIPEKLYTAGSPLDKALSEKFYYNFHKYIHSSYGSTETGEMCIELEDGIFKTGNVGKPLKYTEISIKENEAVKDILVKNPSFMVGYLENGYIKKPDFNENGWYITGDLGTIEKEGRITIMGRSKNIINVFGVKVNPFEVEQVIKTFPNVDDVFVFAGKHRSGSDLVYALIQCREDIDVNVEEIKKYCDKLLTSQKIPTKIKVTQHMPRNSSGKIVREEVGKYFE